MLKALIKFEGHFYFKKWGFYAMLALFLGLGFFVSIAANFSIPNVYKNSPYVLTFAIGLFSLATIFSVTLLTAQSLFKEKDSRFEAILYATPLNKSNFLLSRFTAIFGLTVFSFFLMVIGLMIGQQLPGLNRTEYTQFNAWNYVQPFLVLAVPNAFFSAAVVCSVGWLTKNKLIVYISGLLIYILYIVGSLFSNSPLMAGVSPPSAEAMALSAKLDPFGLVAFFEQTQHWSAYERNTQRTALTGNFLFNRILYLTISAFILIVTHRLFRFTTSSEKRGKSKIIKNQNIHTTSYQPTEVVVSTESYHFKTFFSFFKLDLLAIVKSIPFLLILVIWTFLLGVEIYTTIDAGVRFPEKYASSGLMVNTILATFPGFSLMVILFYSSEMVWRSKDTGMLPLENSTALQHSMVFGAKCLSLAVVPLALLAYSIVIGLVFQLAFQYDRMEWHTYAALFYLAGLPAILSTVAIISIQVFTRHKYAGLLSAAFFMVLTNSQIGRRLGITHPLLRFANSFTGTYSDMNGFGKYVDAFGWQMLYWSAFTIIIGLWAGHLFYRSHFKLLRKSNTPVLLTILLCCAVLVISGNIISQKIIITSRNAENDWQQTYEQRYRPYQNQLQPTIAVVKTNIDLFPESNSYKVYGTYTLVNKTNKAMDTLLLYQDKSIQMANFKISNSILIKTDPEYGHVIYRLLQPLYPGDSMQLDFSFKYNWSAFNRHDYFNAIVENGAFMRISNYYPRVGYQAGQEIGNDLERKKRKMPAATPIKKLEEKKAFDYDYGFIHFDAVISTNPDQIAISVGELKKSWTLQNRRYFHYQTPVPIPFRFAVSSAKYAVQKAIYKDISIEIYYHPGHYENVNILLAKAKNTLAYCENNFGPYPFKTIRFAEISGFTQGFNATAYPASIFMNESMAFHTNIKKASKEAVIDDLASHELSHEWWGTNQLSPDDREGAQLLTETLAMYTELMLHIQEYGNENALDKVNLHKDLYLNARGFSTEIPLIKATSAPHLFYNKGLVVMYQLYLLIGEEKINAALKNLLQKYAYPNAPPTALDLLHEFYAVCDKRMHPQIEDLFARIILHEVKLDRAASKKTPRNHYEIRVEATAFKYEEDGKGNRVQRPFSEPVEVAVYFENGAVEKRQCPVVHNKIMTVMTVSEKPLRVELDPKLNLMELMIGDNVLDLQ